MTGSGWQPINTAPRDREVFFWIVPKSEDETYTDTSGRPIVANVQPKLHFSTFGRWGSLFKATHWHDVPRDPPVAETPAQEIR